MVSEAVAAWRTSLAGHCERLLPAAFVRLLLSIGCCRKPHISGVHLMHETRRRSTGRDIIVNIGNHEACSTVLLLGKVMAASGRFNLAPFRNMIP